MSSRGTEREEKKMRIGRTIIDIESMSIEDLRTIEREIHVLRRRKEEAESFRQKMCNLLTEAQEAGFDFIDKDFGNVIRPEDVSLYDNK